MGVTLGRWSSRVRFSIDFRPFRLIFGRFSTDFRPFRLTFGRF